MHNKWARSVAVTTALVVLVLAVAVWPSAFGGSTVYVTTHGTSMEPFFHQGDLALVRPASAYRVGDVVAYRSHDLGGAVVLHRIVAHTTAGYTFKGDNNPYEDPEHPTDADLLGTLWHRVPQGGRLMTGVRTGLPLLLGGLVMLTTGHTVQRRRRRARPAHLAPRPAAPSSVRSWRDVTIGLGVAAVVCLGLAVVSFGRPTSTASEGIVRYVQQGTFRYAAQTTPGPVYPEGKLRTGDPVFRRLVDRLDVSFDYRVDTAASRALGGTIGVRTVVRSSNGWHRTLDLLPAQAFSGDSSHVTVHLDLDKLESMVQEVAAITGVESGTTTVSVRPEAKVVGTLGAQAIKQEFAPKLDFQLQPLQLTLADTSKLKASAPATLEIDRAVPRQLGALGFQLPVQTVRFLALGLGLPAILGAGAGLIAMRKRLEDEAGRIELRHGHRIVPVSAAGTKNVIEVTSMQDLARLAEQYQALILHRQGQRGHDYLLQADGVVYRYRAREERPARRVLG